MDADEFRPHFGQFTRLWNNFKKDYYEWFRKYYISHYTEHYRKPVPCSFDIDQYVFDPFFKHKQAKELKSTESYWLKSDLDYGLKQWSARCALVHTSVHEISFRVHEIFGVHETCFRVHEFFFLRRN